MVYLEANQKNYGVAAEHSAKFFELARQTSPDRLSPAQRGVLQEALSKRDAITASLARGDAAVTAEIQNIFSKMLRE